MQLLFAISLLFLFLGQPHTTVESGRHGACYFPPRHVKRTHVIMKNTDPFATFSDKIIRQNLKAALKAWAFVQPGDVLSEISAHAPEAVQGNSTFNTIEKLLENGNVKENLKLMYALKNAFVQQADRFLTFYIQEYPSDLLEVLKDEPKGPLLEALSASSPHFFLQNVARTYGFKSKAKVEVGSLGDSFIKYFVDRHPGESIELMMKNNEHKRNEMWLQQVRRRSSNGNIENVEALKNYTKTIKDKNDVVFQALRYKLIEAIKEDRENFFAYFALHISLGNLEHGNFLVETIANFHPNDYLKSLISYEPLSFRTALHKTYHSEPEVQENSSPSAYFALKPSLRNFFEDLIGIDLKAFKNVVTKVDKNATDLDKTFQDKSVDFFKWMSKNIVKFTEEYVKLQHKAWCKVFDKSRNLHLIKRLVEKKPKFFTNHFDQLKPQDKSIFLHALVGDLTDDQLKSLIYTNITRFEEAFNGRKLPNGSALYKENFQKLEPRKFARLFNVTYFKYNQKQYHYIGLFGGIFNIKANEYIRAFMRTLPDQFARTLVVFEPSLGCSFSKKYTQDFAKNVLPLLLTPTDELIDHMIINHKLEIIKTLLAVEVYDGEFSFEDKFAKDKKLHKKDVKKPHMFLRSVLQEGELQYDLLESSFLALYIMLNPKIVFNYIFEVYPFIIDEYLDNFAFQKLLNRISQGHPDVFLKYSLRNKAVDYTGMTTYRKGSHSYETEIKDGVKKAKVIVKEVLRRDRGVFLDVFLKEFDFDQYMPLFNLKPEDRRNVVFKGIMTNHKKDTMHVKMSVDDVEKLYPNSKKKALKVVL